MYQPAAGSADIRSERESDKAQDPTASPATISLLKNGGAIQAIGQNFAANPVTVTAAVRIPPALTGGLWSLLKPPLSAIAPDPTGITSDPEVSREDRSRFSADLDKNPEPVLM